MADFSNPMKNRFLYHSFSFFLSLTISFGYTQENSAAHQIKPEEIDSLIKMAARYSLSNSDSVLVFANKIIHQSDSIGYKKGKLNGLNMIAIYNARNGYYEKALNSFMQLYDVQHEVNDTLGMASAMNNIGNVYYHKGDFVPALQYRLDALELFERIHYDRGIAITSGNIGNIYFDIEEYEEALKWHQKSFDVKKKMGNQAGLAESMNNMGLCFEKLNQLDLALIYHKQSMATRDSLKNSYGLGYSYRNIGHLFQLKKQWAEAEHWYIKSDSIRRINGDRLGLSITLSDLASVYVETNELRKAEKLGLESQQIAREIKAKYQIVKSSELLWNIYNKLSNDTKAYQALKLVTAYKDSVKAEEHIKAVSRLEFEYYEKKRQSEIELLKKQKELGELELKQQQFTVIGILIFLALLIFVVIQLARFSRHKSKSEKQLKKINEKLNSAYEDAEKAKNKALDANELKTQFMNIAAHDLRNPITGIMGFSELLSEGDANSEERELYNQKVQDSCDKMINIIDELLNVNQIDGDEFKLKLEPVEIHEIVSQAVSSYDLRLKQKNQTVTVHSNSKHITISADKHRLLEILENLISNASKYSHINTSIEIKFVDNVQKSWVEIHVIDQGLGFTEAQKNKLFQKFSKIGNQTTNGEHSTGLGLWAVKKMMELHGGFVEASSDGPGKGSTFMLIFPKVS